MLVQPLDKDALEAKKEATRRANREWYLKNKERNRLRTNAWRKLNPLRTKEIDARKRAKQPLEQKLLNGARRRAMASGIPFALLESDIVIPKRCPILGIELRSVVGAKGPQDCSPTLDRIESSPDVGYVPGNVWVISGRANRIKNDGTSREHRLIADAMDAALGRKPDTADDATKTVVSCVMHKNHDASLTLGQQKYTTSRTDSKSVAL